MYYRKNAAGQYEMCPSNLPPPPGAVAGGYKLWIATLNIYEKLRMMNMSLNNRCAACGGQVVIDKISCPVCSETILTRDGLERLSQDEYDTLFVEEIECPRCGRNIKVSFDSKCSKCGTNKSLSVFDVPLTVSTSRAGNSRQYAVLQCTYRSAIVPKAEDLESIRSMIESYTSNFLSLGDQQSVLFSKSQPQ
jgi:predicted RNA-binding Zn-ribbon protein involved in translation (DUF1610 family)